MLVFLIHHPRLIPFENHSSSLLNPSVIDTYILSEQAAGRYSAGFTPSDLELLIGPFHTSPL
ncbi:hypothetical protein EDD22DRAFT_783609, partial [Suillus occidentalis]